MIKFVYIQLLYSIIFFNNSTQKWLKEVKGIFNQKYKRRQKNLNLYLRRIKAQWNSMEYRINMNERREQRLSLVRKLFARWIDVDTRETRISTATRTIKRPFDVPTSYKESNFTGWLRASDMWRLNSSSKLPKPSFSLTISVYLSIFVFLLL